ncbi:MAG TPA: ATP-binding protein [Anaerolineae bacterium]|nr:ATP-binding protein [Anaerolineae bacterium]
MATLTEILEINWIILYSVYGQVFFVTGLVAGLQWRRGSNLELARPLPWLAAFGIAHGLNEWGYIFIPLQALYLDDAVVRLLVIAHLMLLAFSFFFLLQFGVELILSRLSRHSPHQWLRVMPTIMLLVWGITVFLRGTLAQDPLNVLVAIGDAWSRYLLAFPGAILASIGLFRHARQMRQMELPRIATYLTGAAIAFVAYALVGGLIVPANPLFPSNLINYALLDRTIQIPAPVFRSLCGLAMAFFVVRSLEVFQVESDRRIAEMEQANVLAADRERIGRELHDGIVQNIYAAGLGLEEARHLVIEDPGKAQGQIRAVMDALNRTIHDIRRYIFDLRVAEQNRELEVVLEDLVQDLRLDTLLDVHLEVTGQRCCSLDSAQVAHVTQVAREALSNVVQHASATQVTVNLSYLSGATRLAVTDNGIGIAPDALTDNGYQGQGMANMRDRARLLGGKFAMDSEPGRGLRLELTIPCNGCKEKEVETEEIWA